MKTISGVLGAPNYSGYDWTLCVQDEKNPKSEWLPIAQCLNLPIPAKGDVVFHEELNGPLEVVERVWSIREGYPLCCEVRARIASFPCPDPN